MKKFEKIVHNQVSAFIKANHCGATNIAKVSSGFHQADWSTTLGIVYCYPISFF